MANLLPPQLAFLNPLLPYIGPIQILDINDFCSNDPSPIDFTGLVLGAVLAGGQVGAGLVAAQAIAEAVKYYLWFALCECASGPPPTPATPPSDPGNIPVINPPGFTTGPVSAPCKSQNFVQLNTTGNQSFARGGLAHIGLDVTSYRIRATATPVSGSGTTVTMVLSWEDQSINPIVVYRSRGYPLGNNGVVDFVVPAIQGANVLQLTQNSNGGSGVVGLTVQIDAYCGTAPNTTVAPCCPPDPLLAGLLSQVLELVTLIQRQAAPFAYVPGTVHSGLTGSGEISLSGLIGLKVEATAVPGYAGEAAGAPPRLFEVGYVTMGTADGWLDAEPVQHSEMILLPPLGGVLTKVGYYLNPDAEIEITELRREF